MTLNNPEQRLSSSPVTNLRQLFRRRGSVDIPTSPDGPKSPKGSSFPVSVSLTSVRSTSPSPTPERQHSALSVFSRGLRRRVYSELDSDNTSSDTDSSAPRTPEPEPGRELAAHVADENDRLSLQVDSPTSAKPIRDFNDAQPSPISPTTTVPILVVPTAPRRTKASAAVQPGTLLAEFVNGHKELEAIK